VAYARYGPPWPSSLARRPASRHHSRAAPVGLLKSRTIKIKSQIKIDSQIKITSQSQRQNQIHSSAQPSQFNNTSGACAP
jgi:hypothetical protein